MNPFNIFSRIRATRQAVSYYETESQRENKFDFAIKVVCVLFFIQTTTAKARLSKDENQFFPRP